MPEPLRTCVGCRTTSPKHQLVRVVRDASGAAAADPTGTAPGRGAYVHAAPDCIVEALRHGALARALRAGLDREGAVRLRVDLERLQASMGSTERQARTT